MVSGGSSPLRISVASDKDTVMVSLILLVLREFSGMIHFITINNSPSNPSSKPTFRTSKLSQVVIFPSFVHRIFCGINGRIHENLRHLRHPETSAWYGIYYIYSWAWNKLLVQPQVDILIEIVIDLGLRLWLCLKTKGTLNPMALISIFPVPTAIVKAKSSILAKRLIHLFPDTVDVPRCQFIPLSQ